MGVAWHRFTVWPNIWFKRESSGRPALGALAPIMVEGQPIDFAAIEDLDEDASLGVGKVEDFTWKGLLDFTSCTECGRCQSQCPAWNTEKPLSPKLLIMELREHAYAKAPYLQAAEEIRGEVARSRPTRGRPAAGRPDPGEQRGGRSDRPRRALVLHHLRRLRAAVPGGHRARRPHPGYAPLPGDDGLGVPGRAERAVQGPGEQGKSVVDEPARPDGLGQGSGLRGAGGRRGRRGPLRRGLPVLGGLRGRVRGPGQEDQTRGRRAAAHRRRLVRRAGQRRDLHRRPGPAGGQRVRLRPARDGERGDADRGQGDQDRHRLRPLPEHA